MTFYYAHHSLALKSYGAPGRHFEKVINYKELS
jgi:hypothetical protein